MKSQYLVQEATQTASARLGYWSSRMKFIKGLIYSRCWVTRYSGIKPLRWRAQSDVSGRHKKKVIFIYVCFTGLKKIESLAYITKSDMGSCSAARLGTSCPSVMGPARSSQPTWSVLLPRATRPGFNPCLSFFHCCDEAGGSWRNVAAFQVPVTLPLLVSVPYHRIIES